MKTQNFEDKYINKECLLHKTTKRISFNLEIFISFKESKKTPPNYHVTELQIL